MSTENNILIIHHYPCWDGVAAAWATQKGLKEKYPEKNIQLLGAKYGDEPPSLDDVDEVYIVDFSYDRQTLLEMNGRVSDMVVLDHHKTSQEALEGLNFCHFDMDKSGARMAWEFFFDEEPPKWLQYIEDRDLWKWELSRTKEFTAWLRTRELSVANLDLLAKRLGSTEGYFDDLVYASSIFKGEAILAYQTQLVKTIAENAVPVQLGDHTVYAVNTPVLQSEVGNAIADKYGTYAAAYYHTGEGTVKFSLRSNNDLDVSKIAALFGGGGHKNAAGFYLPEEKAATLFKSAIIKP